MYQTSFALTEVHAQEAPIPAAAPGADRDLVGPNARVHSLDWEEHCVECATPECFGTCSLYARRADGECARFAYGIAPNPAFAGLFPFGADVRFRRWGKLEATLERVTSFERGADGAFAEVGATSNPAEVHAALAASAEFVIACHAPPGTPFRLLIEYFVVRRGHGRESRYRGSFEVQPGANVFRVPVEQLRLDASEHNGYLLVLPDEPERRVVFTWLDFVAPRPAPLVHPDLAAPDEGRRPAPKVKCVAWDLDHTLWHGVLVEGDDVAANVRPEVRSIIDALDARGILQTIVSKNDFQQAWRVLDGIGLADRFLHPAINWGQKSENLKAIAARLNIGVDTFALIDDSPFERAEVQTALPEVRVYDVTELDTLLGRPELDVPVTDEGRQRRLLYLAEAERETVRAGFSGDYDAFLRSCGMQLRIFRPTEEAHVLRCHELIQRSNQLNLSGRRLTRAELDQLLADPTQLAVAFACRDRFGDYGIVGFASVDEGASPPRVTDLVISCRVAQKRVEHAFMRWLGARVAARGGTILQADLHRSSKNFPMMQLLKDLGFDLAGAADEHLRMRLRLKQLTAHDEPVTLAVDPALAAPSP